MERRFLFTFGCSGYNGVIVMLKKLKKLHKLLTKAVLLGALEGGC